jgi:hypothetical protein
MKKSDLKAGDTLIDYQNGYAQEFLIIEEDNDLFLKSGTTKRRIEDNNFSGRYLLITSNDRII